MAFGCVNLLLVSALVLSLGGHAVPQEVDPCDELALGFSSQNVDSPVRFDGIAGGQTAQGEFTVLVPADHKGTTHVYADIITGLTHGSPPMAPVLGFSFSIALQGEAELTEATHGGTAVDVYLGGGFQKTEIVDPAKNAGQRGVVSATALCFVCPRGLPLAGTFSLVDISLEAAQPQGGKDITAAFRFQDGLRGSGQPVQNAVTVEGKTRLPCNAFETSVVARFQRDPAQRFTRGNANNDSRVDIADAVWILNELFLGGPAAPCADAADTNNDALLDVSDAIAILRHAFFAGPAPAPPYPSCGVDPEGDEDGVPCNEAQIECP